MKIAVFCSSSNRISSKLKLETFELGKKLAEKGHTLVYGGATGGLMDSIAEGFSSGGAEIIGVIPEIIIRAKRLSKLPTKLIETNTMSDRKVAMNNEADVFVVLTGGFGTLDEMFSVIASATVGEHKKPLICVNIDGFYDFLLKQINVMKQENCTPEIEMYRPIFVDSTNECLEYIEKIAKAK